MAQTWRTEPKWQSSTNQSRTFHAVEGESPRCPSILQACLPPRETPCLVLRFPFDPIPTDPTAHSAFDLRQASKGVAPAFIERVLNRSCPMSASRGAQRRNLERES